MDLKRTRFLLFHVVCGIVILMKYFVKFDKET